ncbi:structural protein [Helicobacter valdiviensis]|uniref:Structural protein n=1 Tax=Helicobacter valdiviensis TaxID=1458358 RepID=A0A2W6MWX6_9HELI|nr:DUF4043 family protein [Helicobacter valdiviensis]PZT47728.1 structural protein [Helicobacter valdiviensis]
MPLDFNRINIAGWESDPNVAVSIAKEIERVSWEESPFEPFVGRGEDRGIKVFEVGDTAPCRPRLRPKLNGAGVEGNADFETNLDNFEILTQTMFPKVVGNAIKSEIVFYQKMKNIDFIKESGEGLKTWAREKRDKNIVCALSNDFTNIVVCDSVNGYKDTTSEKSVQDATKKIVKGDVLNVRAIRRTIFMARTGLRYNGERAFPIKPIRAETKSEKGFLARVYNYAFLVDSYGASQLRQDPEWIELQKMDKRGELNNLFTGYLGIVDGCPIVDVGSWSDVQVGLLNSDVSDSSFMQNINRQNHTGQNITPPSFYTGDQALCLGALVGASALILAGNPEPKFYMGKDDLDRKTICGIDRVLSIAKGRFVTDEEGSLSIYNNTDYAVIGLAYSKES